MSAVPNTGNSGSFSGMDIVQLLALANQYARGNESANASQAPLNSASSFYTDRTQKTGGYIDKLASALESWYGNSGNSQIALPSNTGGSKAYTDAATYGDPSAILKPLMEQDRGNMLQQLMQARDATTRSVDIGDYSVRGVADAADRKFAALAPSVDRAAAIASSQGFGSALKRGVADSTQAVGMADDLTRQFADVYAKLRQQSEDSALADNAAKYQSYLSGKGAQIGQNNNLANAANQLFGTSAQRSGVSEGNFTNAASGVAGRLLQALQAGDGAAINAQQVNNSSMAPLLNALVALNQQGLTTGDSRFRAASGAAQTASSNQSAQFANVMANPWVQNLVNTGFNWAKGNAGSPPPVDYSNVDYGHEGRYSTPPADDASNFNWDEIYGGTV